MFQKLGTFLSRSPPVVLIQYSFFVFAIGLFALSVSIKRATVKDFQSDKAWSRVYGDLAETYICAGIEEYVPRAPSASLQRDHVAVVNDACSPPQSAATEGPTVPGPSLLHQIGGPLVDRFANILLNRQGSSSPSTATVTTATVATADGVADKKAYEAAEEKKKKARSEKQPVMKRFLHSMDLFWTIRQEDACLWRQALDNASFVYVTGTVCGSQLKMAGGNKSWVSFSAQLSVSKLDDCCGSTDSKRSQSPGSQVQKKAKKTKQAMCSKIVLERTCLSTWLPAESVPKHSRSPPACPAFNESHHWLPIAKQPSCANGTGILTPKQRKFHQKSFLFDIVISQEERALASEHLSTLALCVLLVAIAMMAGLVYRSKPEKRIVALENLKS